MPNAMSGAQSHIAYSSANVLRYKPPADHHDRPPTFA
jgi:hypothetical protein